MALFSRLEDGRIVKVAPEGFEILDGTSFRPLKRGEVPDIGAISDGKPVSEAEIESIISDRKRTI